MSERDRPYPEPVAAPIADREVAPEAAVVPEAAVAVGVAGAEGGIANDRTRVVGTSGFSLTIREVQSRW